MELWEGGILVAGGVLLVAYMASKNKAARAAAQPTVIGSTATMTGLGTLGTTNQSNLTTITNTAAGQPTVYGEPLEPYVPPIVGPVIGPMPVAARPATPIFRPPVIFGPRFAAASPVVSTGAGLSTARTQLL